MTRRQVALLRGINVGHAKRIAMADLRALVESLGYSEVRTLLNSGNVVFTASSSARGEAGPRIEAAIAKRLGVSTRVTVLAAAELATAIAENPLLDVAKDPSRHLLGVLRRPADRARLEPLSTREWGPEALAVGRRVAYLWCPLGFTESLLFEAVGRALGEDLTTRNWSTMLKLGELARAQV